MDYQQGWTRPPAPLRGLDPTATYTVTDRDGKEVHRACGFDLMTVGMPGDASRGSGYSRTLYVTLVGR